MIEFRNVRGHIEVYIDGVFQFSADNLREAEQDLEAHLAGKERCYA